MVDRTRFLEWSKSLGLRQPLQVELYPGDRRFVAGERLSIKVAPYRRQALTVFNLAPGGVIGISTPNQRSVLDVVAGALYRASLGRVTWPLEKFYIEQHFLYFSPATLEAALARAGLGLVTMRRELTDLRRLTLTPLNKAALVGMFALARVTGLENRLYALAADPADAGGSTANIRPPWGMRRSTKASPSRSGCPAARQSLRITRESAASLLNAVSVGTSRRPCTATT